jgi:hypothetical protein
MNKIVLPPLPEPVYTYDGDGNKVFYEKASLVRARDLEVARLVLEAAADFMKMEGFGGYAIAIRALEVKHG